MLKHRSVLRAAVVLLAVSGLGASAVVFAESEERSASDSVIEEIVVTATHRETNLMDTEINGVRFNLPGDKREINGVRFN